MAGPGAADAAVLRIKGSRKAIALAVDGNGRYCQLDPYTGGQIAVAEVCRNLSCVGARPLALTDCLNFGSPRRPDIYYQLEECIRGMAAASEILDAPVVSGNVSLFNETQGQAVLPTPVVGALGLLDDAAQTVGAAFPAPDLAVMLLGPGPETAAPEDLAGSEYLHLMHGMTAGRPRIDLELERRTQQACRQAIAAGLIRSAHDCSDGGLLTALAESSILGGIGFRLATPPPFPPDSPARDAASIPANPPTLDASPTPAASPTLDASPTPAAHPPAPSFPRKRESSGPPGWDAVLFGEKQSRIIVSLDPGHAAPLREIAAALGVPATLLGFTGGDRFDTGYGDVIPLADLTAAWTQALEASGD